jgi:hypothetical protein
MGLCGCKTGTTVELLLCALLSPLLLQKELIIATNAMIPNIANMAGVGLRVIWSA